MASLGSKIKSAVNKVSSLKNNAQKSLQSFGSNLSKQASALSSSLGASAKSSTSSFGGMSVPTKSGGIISSTGALQVSKPKSSSKVSAPSSAPMSIPGKNGYPVSSSSSALAYNPQANSSNVATGKPRVGGSSSSNKSLGASAYDALTSALGGSGRGAEETFASDNAPGVSGGGMSYAPKFDTYKGNTGVSNTNYFSGQGQSLEAQATQPSPTQMYATPEQRAQNQGIVSTYESGKAEREAQIAALTAQRDQLQSVYDSLANKPMDPLAPQKDPEEDAVAQQIKAMEEEMERLTRVPDDVLAAQKEEESLLAEEARIKDQMNQDLYGIKGQAIPQGFITGQGARVQDLANVGLDRIAGQKVTLQQKLANAQQRRQAALDVVREKLNRTYDRADTLDARKYDEKKRKADVDASKEKDRYVTLSDGAQLYDTLTGKIVENTKNYAPRSSSSNNPSTVAGEAELRASRGADGYVDPNVYLNLFNNWNGTTESFVNKYPPKLYVNPANTWLPPYLRPTASTGRSI